ncbi:hypothetical protein UPYG_G00268950 [Umbra pygmaea]|uniref:RNA helicase n=1 Tax=Umbra pygmaea TaxID=75934 RepID=A0ABD0WWE1_UMBPY
MRIPRFLTLPFASSPLDALAPRFLPDLFEQVTRRGLVEVGAMLEINILKVENPSCIWGGFVKGTGVEAAKSGKEYDDLQLKMNLFYHGVNLDVRKVKLSSIVEGQVCVVYWSAPRSWCRAIIESLFQVTGEAKAMCFLVDHGERISVSFQEIRAPMDKFLQLPFRGRKFQLAGIQPMTLHVSGDYLEKAELIPSTQWDSSATRYLHNLVHASTQMEAVLCETQADCSSIELYLTVKNVKICVNDELVLKKFAYYKSEKTSQTSGPLGDRSPAVLACDLFSQTQTFLATDGCTARSLSEVVSCQQNSTIGNHVTVHDQVTFRRKVSTEISKPQKSLVESQVKDFDEDNNKAAQNMKSETISEINGRDESEKGAVEDTDTTLQLELLENLNLFRFMKFLNPASKTQMAVVPNLELDEADGGAAKQICGTAEKESVSAAQPIGLETKPSVWHFSESCDSERPPVGPVDPACTELRGLVDTQTEVSVFTRQSTAEEELVCARLMQLLNPDPLKLEEDSSEACGWDLSRSSILVHSALTLDPCTSLANAPITDTYRRVLMRKQYAGPSLAEKYCWPALARGCDTVLISHSGDTPLSYLPPMLAHMQLSSAFRALPSRTGPIAVILCPGWEKAQTVFDLLEESQTTQHLHPMVILVGLGKDDATNVKIQKTCQLIVSTPFSLVRLLGVHCFQFLRLCYLVLDEVDLLYSRAPSEMATILQHFQKVTSGDERASCVRQIIAVGKRWSHHLQGLLHDHMSNPTIVFTVMEEAALYGNVHQMILLCLDCTKISVMLGALDLTPDVAQKTLIITSSAEEVEHVFKAVSNTSAFSLKAHEGLTYQFDFVIEQWKKPIGPGTHVILVTNNECMKALGIRDATCIVHYSFPITPKLFGSRLFCMSQNFQNLSDMDSGVENQAHLTKSVLLLSEKNARHVIGVLRYLKRTEALLPTELMHFAEGVQQAKEEQKTERPLCLYLKSFGFCRDSSVCPDRHSISPMMDRPLHPDSGTIVVLPLYIKTASVYYGRIVSKKEDRYESLASEMTAYYTTQKLNAKEVLEGSLYGVQEDEVYHRVQVTSVPDKGECLFSSVRALFLDEGREQEVKSHQLLQLPAQFHSLPPQALELVVCRAMPIDAEVDWNPKVTRAISQKIKGLQHQAKVVLSLGNTVFVDPMVRMTHLPGLKTFINEYNVYAEILSTGMGTSNPQHLDLLKELCHGLGPKTNAGETPLSSELGGSKDTMEDKVQAAEEALVHRMKEAVDSLHSGQNISAEPPRTQTTTLNLQDLPRIHGDPKDSAFPSQTLISQVFVPPSQTEVPTVVASNLSMAKPPTVMDSTQIAGPVPTLSESQIPAQTPADSGPVTEQWRSLIEKLKCALKKQRYSALPGFSVIQHASENGNFIDNEEINSHQVINTENVIKPTSFHPQIKWFQRDDVVILNVKLREPEEQSCEFFLNKVVYSARMNDKLYRADLELHSNISADKCSWEMKCNEPVIRLVKHQRGNWKMLLKKKSAFVSLDFDHFEEDAKTTSNGLCIMGHTGESGCYVDSGDGSDSD